MKELFRSKGSYVLYESEKGPVLSVSRGPNYDEITFYLNDEEKHGFIQGGEDFIDILSKEVLRKRDEFLKRSFKNPLTPFRKSMVEDQGWNFKLLEQNGKFELIVPSPKPAPGADVIHFLNPEEISAYKEKGAEALKSRIEDMKTNYSNYKTFLWR